MAYMIKDFETGTRTYLKRKASRWHEDNYIVAAGWKIQGDKQASWEYVDKPSTYMIKIPERVTVLVGHNLKFDLLWQWDNPQLIAFFKRGGRIWDTQYAEYLLHAQEQKYQYAALSEVAPRYGGTRKIDEVKILWDAGVETADINKDLLLDYLVGTVEEGRNGGDIGNTEQVFLGQLKMAKELDMLTALWSRMDGLCATTEMEWNGLKIDLEEAKRQLVQLTADRATAKDELQGYVPGMPDGLEFKWTSRVHKSCLIFGGTVKYKKKSTYTDPKTGELARLVAHEDWPLFNCVPKDPNHPDIRSNERRYFFINDGVLNHQDTFKGGKRKGEPKTKKVKVDGELKTKYCDFYYTFGGYTTGRHEWRTKNTDARGAPLFSTKGENIEALAGTGVPFCTALASYEALEKEITTYFISRGKDGKPSGMLTCVDPKTHIIHHMLNNVATITGRLSSSDPNLQNIPRGDKSKIKKLFVSRYRDGSMLEADYSQLEVVVQGVLSGDKQLMKDLRDKIDFHCKRVAIQPKYNTTYNRVLGIIADEDHPDHAKWKLRRTTAKIFSFQRAYGAGAALIALSTGMDVDDVKGLIKAEEATYPGVVKFNKNVEKAVGESCVPFRDHEEGKFYRRGYYTSPTGCRYTFRSYDAQDWQKERGIADSFSPTEMKNYPVQGTGGEIVQGMCGRLWRHFVSNDNYGGQAVLCNTVHDCVWVDTASGVTEQVAADVQRIMESVDDWFLQFGVKITVPFPVDVEAGPNMLDLKHVKEN